MARPLSRMPVFTPPLPGEPYRPASVSPAREERIKAMMRANRIQVTPDNYRHALEAEEIRDLLQQVGIDPTKRVSATQDHAGMVRLTFAQLRRVVSAAEDIRAAMSPGPE